MVTNNVRGGTWLGNKAGIEFMEELGSFEEGNVGGNNTYKLNNPPKNPYVVKSETIMDGSMSVYIENPEVLGEKAKTAIRDIEQLDMYKKNDQKKIKKILIDLGVEQELTNNAFKYGMKNIYDIVHDIIISRDLKKKGYDAIIIIGDEIYDVMNKENKGPPIHLFKFG